MNVGIWGWDEVALPLVSQWRKLRVDADGHLQVDVITAGGTASHCMGFDGGLWNPLLVESAANANLRTRLYAGATPIGSFNMSLGTPDPGDYEGLVIVSQPFLKRSINVAYPQSCAYAIGDNDLGYWTHVNALWAWDGARFDRLRVGAPADALATSGYALDVRSFLMGYNGETWDMLRMQTSVYHNLRVALYYNANMATIETIDVDNEIVAKAALHTKAFLYGFDGTYWDRLRTWGTGILKVGRAEIDSTTIRHTAVGSVIDEAAILYWIACSPDTPGAEWELSDDTDGSTAAVYDHFDSDKHSEHLIFDPPMKFANGIYIKKFDHMHSLVFCYV